MVRSGLASSGSSPEGGSK